MILITADTATLDRAQAIAHALTLAGHAATPLVVDTGFTSGNLPAGTTGLLALDPGPEALDTVSAISCPATCLYTALFDKAASAAMVERHAANSVPHLWERVRPAIRDAGIEPVLLPAPTRPIPAADGKFDAPPRRPVIGVMAPPLEISEAVAVQEAYLDLDAPAASLAVFNPPQCLDNMASKIAMTAGWYLPDLDGGPVWSFEMTAILMAGGNIACGYPPRAVSQCVTSAGSLEAAIEALIISDSAGFRQDELREGLAQNFIQTLNASGLLG